MYYSEVSEIFPKYFNKKTFFGSKTIKLQRFSDRQKIVLGSFSILFLLPSLKLKECTALVSMLFGYNFVFKHYLCNFYFAHTSCYIKLLRLLEENRFIQNNRLSIVAIKIGLNYLRLDFFIKEMVMYKQD